MILEEEYLVFKNMKIRNIFEGFESKFDSEEFEFQHDEDSIWYVLRDNELDKQITAVGFGRGSSMFERYNNDAYILEIAEFQKLKIWLKCMKSTI